MNSNPLIRRVSAAAGIGATIAMVTLGAACSQNADNQPGSGPDGTSTTSGTVVSSISSQLSSVISSLKPSG